MQKCEQLLAPEAFAIERIIFSFSRLASDRDIYSIAESFTWSLWLGMKRYLGSPLISLQTIDYPTHAPIRICDYCQSVYACNNRCPGCGAQQFTLSTVGSVETGRGFMLDIGRNQLVIEN